MFAQGESVPLFQLDFFAQNLSVEQRAVGTQIFRRHPVRTNFQFQVLARNVRLSEMDVRRTGTADGMFPGSKNAFLRLLAVSVYDAAYHTVVSPFQNIPAIPEDWTRR